MGYTGTIQTNGYASPALWVNFTYSGTLNNLRFSYAKTAIQLKAVGGNTTTIAHSQFVNCIQGLDMTGGRTATIKLHNCLMANVQTVAVDGAGSNSYNLNNCTMDNSAMNNTSSPINSTNSVFSNSEISFASGSGNYNGFYSFSGAPFGSNPLSIMRVLLSVEWGGTVTSAAGGCCITGSRHNQY